MTKDLKREEKRAYDATRYAANREEIRARNNAYNASHREEMLAYNASRREEKRVYAAAYYAAHREERAASDAARYAAKREEILADHATYYVANREKITAYGATYRKSNSGAIRSRNAARKAMQRTQRCTCCNKEQIAEFYKQAALCGRFGHVDHIVQLSLGGPHCAKNLKALTIEEHIEKSKLDAAAKAGSRRRNRLLHSWTRFGAAADAIQGNII